MACIALACICKKLLGYNDIFKWLKIMWTIMVCTLAHKAVMNLDNIMNILINNEFLGFSVFTDVQG